MSPGISGIIKSLNMLSYTVFNSLIMSSFKTLNSGYISTTRNKKASTSVETFVCDPVRIQT